jgi:hypothetical protein
LYTIITNGTAFFVREKGTSKKGTLLGDEEEVHKNMDELSLVCYCLKSLPKKHNCQTKFTSQWRPFILQHKNHHKYEKFVQLKFPPPMTFASQENWKKKIQ